jgi:hypothetical protein
MNVSCRFVYRFEKIETSETEEVVVEDAQSSFDAYQRAREKMIDKTKSDIRSFESQWDLKESEIAIGVSKFPKKDLTNNLANISGVKSANRLEANDHTNHDLYFVKLSDLINEAYVIDKIRGIISDVEIEDGEKDITEILIIFNPQYYKHNM